MKTRIVMISILLIGITKLYGSINQFHLAKQYYDNTNFSKAQQVYETVLKNKPDSVPALYNLGNIYFNQNMLGKAKFFYKKAHYISPRDSDIQHNIRVIEAELIDEVKPSFSIFLIIKKGIDMITIPEFFLLGSIVFTIGNIALIWCGMVLNKKWVKPILVTSYSGLLIIMISIGVKINIYKHQGIIISKKIPIKSGPLTTFPTLFYLHEGTELTILTKAQKWSKVKLNNKFIGWIENQHYWKIQ